VLRKFLAYSDGNEAYENTLGKALDTAFGVQGPSTTTPSSPGPPPTASSTALQQAIAAAEQDEAAAEAALRRGDFAAYGRDEQALKHDLERIKQAAGHSS
jgi:uncharacterized membrane protein (UPF0182 family)